MLTEIIRACARPIISIIFAATIAQVVVERIDAPEWFVGLGITVIMYYFGERTITKHRERKNANYR